MRRLTTILLVAASTAVAAAADATIIISEGLTGGSGDVDNVVFDDQPLISSGNPVIGLTRSGSLVEIWSDEDLVVNPLGPPAVTATDGGFATIRVALPAADAFKVQFALDLAGAGTIGDIRISMTDDQSAKFVQEFLNVGPGVTFFTGIGSAGRSITGFTIEGLGEGLGSRPAEIAALRRLRVGIGGDGGGGSADGGIGDSGGDSSAVRDISAPGALGLLALALAGLGLYRLARRAG